MVINSAINGVILQLSLAFTRFTLCVLLVCTTMFRNLIQSLCDYLQNSRQHLFFRINIFRRQYTRLITDMKRYNQHIAEPFFYIVLLLTISHAYLSVFIISSLARKSINFWTITIAVMVLGFEFFFLFCFHFLFSRFQQPFVGPIMFLHMVVSSKKSIKPKGRWTVSRTLLDLAYINKFGMTYGPIAVTITLNSFIKVSFLLICLSQNFQFLHLSQIESISSSIPK